MQKVSSAIGAAANLFRRGKPPATGDDAKKDVISVPWRGSEGRTPVGWNGMCMSGLRPWSERFPCFGRACAAEDRWHPAGSLCVLYKDCSMDGMAGQWQTLCSECADAPENAGWPKRQAGGVSSSSACASSSRPAAALSSMLAAKSRAPEQQEEPCDDWGPQDEAELQRLECSNTTRAAFRQAAAPEAAPAQAQPLCLRCDKVGPCACYMMHDDERALAKGLWAEVATRMPHLQHDGRLAMPCGGKAVDLKQLAADFPSLPYIRAQPAEVRASKLLAQGGGK